MGDVIAFPEKKTEDNAEQAPVEFTAELVREYSETLSLGVAILDRLNKEETDSLLWACISFNHTALLEIERLYGELEEKD